MQDTVTVFPLGMVSILSGVFTWVSRTTRNSDFAILYGVLFVGFAYICGLIIGLLQCNWAYHGANVRQSPLCKRIMPLFLYAI